MGKILDKRVPNWLSTIVILLVICLCSMQLLASDPKPAPASHNDVKAVVVAGNAAQANPAPVPHTPAVETPGPEVFKDPEYMKLAEYVGWRKGAEAAVADANHTSLAKTHKHDFDEWLLEHGVKVYDEGAVDRYLQKIADGLNDRRTQSQAQARTYYSVDWFPLEGRDRSNIVAWGCTGCVASSLVSENSVWTSTTLSGFASGAIGSSFPVRVSTEEPDDLVAASHSNVAYAAAEPPKEYYTKPIPKRVLALMADVKDCFPDAKFDVSDIREVKDPFLRVRFDWGTEILAKWDEPSFK